MKFTQRGLFIYGKLFQLHYNNYYNYIYHINPDFQADVFNFEEDLEQE